jgi:phospholipid-binding lipoprotein MlaA
MIPSARPSSTLAVVGLVLAVLLSGCANAPAREDRDPHDPFERYNRAVYRFNDALDRNVARPVAVVYQEKVPQPARTGVNNFANNLSYPVVIVNNALQGKFGDAVADTGRFVINTTIGILGIFDPASKLGLERNNEDFGQTLGVWGAGPGPYLVLPILGPSTVRDASGLAVDSFYFDPMVTEIDTPDRYGVFLLRGIDTRARLLEADRFLEDEFDPYITIREAYLQRRRHLIYDGDPPPDEFDDDWNDDWDDDDDWEWED